MENAGMLDLNVVITGCSCGGKSTLLRELSKRGFATVSEPGREIVRAQLSSGGDALPWENVGKFSALCIEQGLQTLGEASGLTFFDRSYLDNICGLQALGLMEPRHLQIIDQFRYADRVFFAPPWPEIYEQDEERRHGFDEALSESERLKKFYPAHGYKLIELPKSIVDKRADFVLSHFAD